MSSYTDQLELWFRNHPEAWVRGEVLMTVCGKYAWRTRVSEVRLRLQARAAGTIENRQRRVTKPDGKYYTVSEYRYKPVMTPQPSLFS
jgi:hypothetical protein